MWEFFNPENREQQVQDLKDVTEFELEHLDQSFYNVTRVYEYADPDIEAHVA
jgi:hypothetical protein